MVSGNELNFRRYKRFVFLSTFLFLLWRLKGYWIFKLGCHFNYPTSVGTLGGGGDAFFACIFNKVDFFLLCINLFAYLCYNFCTIRPHVDLLATVKRRKLQWYGHVSRSPGLAETILQGAVKGGRRQGRQRKRWEDNIREWTGLEFAKSQRAVENMGKWRKLVAKSSVVPQRPSWLRDRWEKMRMFSMN